jgi:TRAP-type C4-dicarboxylate transport system permease small subunit
MLKALDKIIRIGDRIYVTISVLLLAVLVIAVSAGVVARYFFNSPFDWTEELVTLIFIWISFLGAAVASARHKHVVVDFLTARASPFARTLIGVFSDLLTIVFLAMVIIGAVILVPQMLHHASVALNIPRSVYYMAVLASSALIFLVHLSGVIKGVKVLLGKEGKEEAK